MIDALLTDAGKIVLAYGLLGAYSLAVTLALVWAVKSLRQNDTERREEYTKVVLVNETASSTIKEVVASMQERNKHAENINQSILMLNQGFKTLTDFQALRDERLLEKLNNILNFIDRNAK